MEKTFLIKTTQGLEEKIATMMVSLSLKYEITLKLVYKDFIVDINTLLHAISLEVPSGENITLIVTGKDTKQAINEFETHFK